MPQVDKIYVEVTADLRATDRSMAQVEQRVNTMANRVSTSVAKADAAVTSKPSRTASGARRGSLDRLIMGTPNRMIGAFIGVGAIGGAMRGVADAIEDADTGWQNIAYHTSKHLPILRDVLSVYEAIYAKQYDISQLTADMARMDAAGRSRREAESGITDLERRARVAGAPNERARKRAGAELEIEDIRKRQDEIRQNIEQGASQPEVKRERMQRLDAAVDTIIGSIMRGLNQPSTQGRFDNVNTVFGSMRVRSGGIASQPANAKKQDEQLSEQKKTNDKLEKIARGGAFIAFA